MRNEAGNKIKTETLQSFLYLAMEIEFCPIVILIKDFKWESNICILERSCRQFAENKVELGKMGSRKACQKTVSAKQLLGGLRPVKAITLIISYMQFKI